MSEQHAKGSDAFEPPKYLACLIAAVNDGAKAAQAGALVFALVGVYLLATAFSASDEDLLRGRAVTISQIGATLPVSFSFAIAPVVFIFLHIYTLARYDMLAANVRQFLAELQTVPLETDRERCRLLLANVEFIQALVAPPGSRLYSPVWRWLVRALIAVFPVVVLLVVQLNALRYQSELITRVQQLGVLLDLLSLVWFFHRVPLERSTPRPRSRIMGVRRWAKLLWLPVIVMGLNLVYMNVVPADANIGLVRYEAGPKATWAYLTGALRQPLDVLLCPSLKWGCRYLRVDHRTLLDHVWDEKAMADLRRGGADQVRLAAIEGLVLRDRSLRFAVLDGSSLFAADLTGADLRAASLENAGLFATKLSRTLLKGADLHAAQLQGADLTGVRESYAGRSIYHFPQPVQLQGADLSDARLQGANLTFTELQGSLLNAAQLQGATLMFAQLQGATLNGAQLQGADLSQAQLQGADLGAVRLRGATLAGSDLGLSDLRKADFTTPLTEDEIKIIHSALDASPSTGRRALTPLSAADQSADLLRYQLSFTASPEQQVLVSDPKDPFFANIPTEWLITSPTPAYNAALVALLADELASRDPVIADRLADRAAFRIDLRHLGYDAVACRLLANAGAGKVKLEQRSIDLLSVRLRECERTKPTAPH